MWSAFEVSLDTLEGILDCIAEGGKVASFGEGMALSRWEVRRLEFLDPWKFKGRECRAWRRIVNGKITAVFLCRELLPLGHRTTF